ncbi:1A family penicillin-binding protein [Alicyclobacillus sacchari]|uniref:1A family penicillin-binding protein n=1 Tax=Alicyclobacillus sacchari TaxID=392010 RepID=A0A4R8LRC1_9BACL|nr:PBP1A family penicillin-binding protein [Alicyclobacillus sacchari]TDY50130.1 1A family penicillin-binding protein [Alicyclobacillus sacchari]
MGRSWPSLAADKREATKVFRRRKSTARILLSAFFIPLGIGFGGMSLLLIGLRIMPLPEGGSAMPTEIESADGTRIANWTTTGEAPQNVPLDHIPEPLVAATIAVEDQNFYRDHAISLKSTARALVVNLRHGGVVEGGSTITQQLAKNLYLSQDRTISRKLREAMFAIQLELHKSKDWILGRYLNVVYYGHGAYGVQAASKLYFNKPVEDLDLAECALLAGLPKGPSIYSPIDHFDRAKQRQRVVLERMVATGYLTQAQAQAAAAEPIHVAVHHTPVVTAPYFTDLAVREAKRVAHLSDSDLDAGAVRIKTTLDPLLQQAAERAIASTLPKNSGIQAALVAMDPKTGAIRALVGGRNFQTSPFNRALAPRQPGSTFKAIVYSAALEHGWTPAKQVDSKLTTFVYGASPADRYTVHDYADVYAGRPLTLREAIARSDNVYAVHTNLAIGPQHVIDMAHRLGIADEMKPYPSLALGVFPISPVEMAGAYAALANGGLRVTPHAVAEIDTPDGRTTVDAPITRALSPDVAFQMSDLMQSVLGDSGTGYGARPYLHAPAAAKTGTTDTDAWMVGYTPNLVCAVWVGYDSNRPLSVQESHMAAPIWGKFMGTAQVHMPGGWFAAPADLKAVRIDPLSGGVATPECRIAETDYFRPGTEPTEPCPLHSSATPQKAVPKSGLFGWLRKLF